MNKITVNTAMMACFFWVNLPMYLAVCLSVLVSVDMTSIVLMLSASLGFCWLWWYSNMPKWEAWAKKRVSDLTMFEARLSGMRTFQGRRIP